MISNYTNLNLYVYCGNDPVNYYDPTGCAKIYLKTLIASDILYAEASQYPEEDYMQYRKCALLLISSGNRWIENMNKGGSNINYCISDAQDFYDTWNSLVSTTAVIIMAHGAPTVLGFGNELVSAASIANNLNVKSIKFVWLTSCNAGHYSFRNTNIASAIAKKISGGVVVAADGTVYMGSKTVYGIQNIFTGECVGDDRWKSYARDRVNAYGWMIYRYTSGGQTLSVYTTSFTSNVASIFDVSNYLVNRGFVSYK